MSMQFDPKGNVPATQETAVLPSAPKLAGFAEHALTMAVKGNQAGFDTALAALRTQPGVPSGVIDLVADLTGTLGELPTLAANGADAFTSRALEGVQALAKLGATVPQDLLDNLRTANMQAAEVAERTAGDLMAIGLEAGDPGLAAEGFVTRTAYSLVTGSPLDEARDAAMISSRGSSRA